MTVWHFLAWHLLYTRAPAVALSALYTTLSTVTVLYSTVHKGCMLSHAATQPQQCNIVLLGGITIA